MSNKDGLRTTTENIEGSSERENSTEKIPTRMLSQIKSEVSDDIMIGQSRSQYSADDSFNPKLISEDEADAEFEAL